MEVRVYFVSVSCKQLQDTGSKSLGGRQTNE